MVTTKQARKSVDDALAPMRHALGLNNWRVTVIYECEAENKACVNMSHTHEQATITINPDAHADKADVLESLRHELMHLYHAEFMLSHDVAEAHMKRRGMRAYAEASFFAGERCVAKLQRMADFCGLTPEKLVSIGRKDLKK